MPVMEQNTADRYNELRESVRHPWENILEGFVRSVILDVIKDANLGYYGGKPDTDQGHALFDLIKQEHHYRVGKRDEELAEMFREVFENIKTNKGTLRFGSAAEQLREVICVGAKEWGKMDRESIEAIIESREARQQSIDDHAKKKRDNAVFNARNYLREIRSGDVEKEDKNAAEESLLNFVGELAENLAKANG